MIQIKNLDDISDELAMSLVSQVIKIGKNSMECGKKRYCFVTTFEHDGITYIVSRIMYRKNDIFYVYKQKNK